MKAISGSLLHRWTTLMEVRVDIQRLKKTTLVVLGPEIYLAPFGGSQGAPRFEDAFGIKLRTARFSSREKFVKKPGVNRADRLSCRQVCC